MHGAAAVRKLRRQQQKLETWKMLRPDSICEGRRRSGRRKRHKIFFPAGGAIYAASTGLSQQKGGMARFPPKSSQDVWGSQQDWLQEINSSCVAERSSMKQPISNHDMRLVGVVSLWYCAPIRDSFFYAFFYKGRVLLSTTLMRKQSLRKFKIICCQVLQRQSNLPKRQ